MAKVTINDIARAAGVSKTAVSFAFNAPDQLAASTVEHIREIAEQLGYTPDPIARSMTTKRTNALGLLLPHDIAEALANPFYTQFMRGIGRVCGEAGVTLMLVPPLRGSRLKAIPHATVDGFIVIGFDLDRDEVQLLRRRTIPFVVVDSSMPSDISSVNVDDRSGAQTAMEYVLAQGHRQIGVICFESDKNTPDDYTGTVVERTTGYRAALSAYGIAPNDPAIRFEWAPSNWQGGYDAFMRLSQSGVRPTAVVGMSDIIALGVMDAARAQGLDLPADLSVIGFDDVPEARQSHPALTTVRQPGESKGALAADLLVRAIAEGAQAEHHLLPTELVIRHSVAAPRIHI